MVAGARYADEKKTFQLGLSTEIAFKLAFKRVSCYLDDPALKDEKPLKLPKMRKGRRFISR